MICEVIVDINNKQVNRPFDYAISAHLENVIEVGMRVIVNFNNRDVMGFVVKIKEFSEFPNVKEIKEILDVIPCLNAELLDLAYYIHENCSCFLIDALKTLIPTALKAKYQKLIKVINRFNLDEALQQVLLRDEVVYQKNLEPFLSLIKKAYRNKDLDILNKISNHGKEKWLRKIQVKNAAFPFLTKKQKEIVEYLCEVGEPVEKSFLVHDLGYSASIIKTLCQNNVLEELLEENYREINSLFESTDKDINLNDEQINAFEIVKNYFHQYQVCLLHGVTGSGKTEIYLNLIAEVVKNNQEAILLVPEISLTPLMVMRVKGRFKDDVAVLHSGLSIGEKYDEWRKIMRGEVKIVVGARSAIFAPFKNIGLIIIDEEHETTYKQDTQPKYHAIDIAKKRAEFYRIPLLLGSATPSVESYYEAVNKRYHLIEINKRANKQVMPKVEIINMADELKNGNKSMFSYKLQYLIAKRLSKNEQTILFLNRRGFSSFVMCRSCGEVVQCEHCDITMTYHKEIDRLKCHYCGHQKKNITVCPTCQSAQIRHVGVGTQKVVEELQKLYENAKISRMDMDNTKTKGAHEAILFDFANHKTDILVGTQMIAKGLDFPKVTLVGNLMADLSLKIPDFRANERTFQLICQVAGRAGRHEDLGEVIVQTYNTKHFAIMTASRHDYKGFYEKEINLRKIGNYPPFYLIAQILVKSKEQEQGLNAIYDIYKLFKNKNIPDLILLGPSQAQISKVNDFYQMILTIKYQHHQQIAQIFSEIMKIYQSNKEIHVLIDNKM